MQPSADLDRHDLDWYGDGSLCVVNIALACCALEFESAAAAIRVSGAPATGTPRGAWGVVPPHGAAAAAAARRTKSLRPDARVVVVVSGTVTDRLAPGVLAVIDACTGPDGVPPTVVSFGACASAGGPYWDSYAVTKGIDQLVAVDVYVPGCPPPPEALTAVLDQLTGR